MMKKMFNLGPILVLLFLSLPAPILGSRPVDYTLVGCVTDGMLFSLRQANPQGGAAAEMWAYWIKIIPPTVDLAPYEGKKIRLRGFLLPGDRFQPDLNTLETLGTCDAAASQAVRKKLPQAYKERAKERAAQGDWDKAWQDINQAITLDASQCSAWMTRADFHRQQGNIAAAVQDAQTGVQQGCNRYPDFAFLAELREQGEQPTAALEAYQKALAVCQYQPDRDRFQQKIDQLQRRTATSPPPAGGRFQGASGPGTLPPPPPLPE